MIWSSLIKKGTIIQSLLVCHCRSQEIGSFGSNGDVFGSLNTTQQLTGKYSATSNPNPFSSVGGNPFG